MSAASEHHTPTEDAARVFQHMLTAFRTAASEVTRSFWPNAENAWLAAAELQIARRSTRYAAPFMVAAAFAIALGCKTWIAGDVRLGWSVAIALIAVILNGVTRSLERRPLATVEQVRFRAQWQTGFTAIFLAAWCSMGLFLWAPGIAFDHMFIALVLAASLAGSITLTAVHPATAAVIIVCHATALIAPLAFSTIPLDHTLAGLAVVFVTMMTVQAVVLHASHKKMLTLEHERSDLVEGLRLAKQESDRERARATAAGRTKSQFLSNMNHELRTPMNAILGFSELIKHKAFGDAVDKYTEYAEIIHQSGQNLLRLIDDMLDLAKIENGKLSLRESEFSLTTLLAEIAEEYETKTSEANLTMARSVVPGLSRIYGDERAIRQIVINLVSNALKFTQAGGRVTLFARLEEDGRLAFGVEDTGIGIAKDMQALVFERFGQGRHDVTSVDKGTGLGLAIVKGFAEALDGDVTLESRLGAGTRVTVRLPAERVLTQPIRKVS